MEETDEFDDFLFDSIMRYDTLQMFNLDNVPTHALQLDEVEICIASQRSRGSNSELLRLQLPNKLSLPPDEEGRSKGNDFKLLSGTFTEDVVSDMDVLSERSGRVVISECGVSGLKIYRLRNEEPGCHTQPDVVSAVPWTSSSLHVIRKTNNILSSKNVWNSVLLLDAQVGGEKVKEINHPFMNDSSSSNPDKDQLNMIKCEALTKDVTVILNSHTGNVVIHDLRTDDNCFTKVPKFQAGTGCGDKFWTISRHDSPTSSPNKFALVSDRKRICMYDMKANSLLFERSGMDVCSPVDDYNRLKLKFDPDEGQVSVSGHESVVDVYRLNETDLRYVFSHNGHSPGKQPGAFVNDHLWLSLSGCVSQGLIVSICNNKTLNCWNYNTEHVT